jgi:hypothetical protein
MTGCQSTGIEALAGSFEAFLRQRRLEAIRAMVSAPADRREEAYRYLYAVASALEAFQEQWEPRVPPPAKVQASPGWPRRHLRVVGSRDPE